GGRTGAADIDDDVFDDGGLFLRRKLVRDGPARGSSDETEFVLARQRIELVHDTIDVERQAVTLLADTAVVVETALDAIRGLNQRAYRHAPFTQLRQHRRMPGRQPAAFDGADRIGEE